MKRLILALLIVLCGCTPAMAQVGSGTFTGVAHGTPNVAPGYAWSLGDIEALGYEDRFDIDWDHSTWANAYDTEAELTSSPISWGLYTFTDGVDGIECDADVSGSLDEDEAAIASIFAAQCTTDPDGGGGSDPLACNKVFKIPANCQLDVLATPVSGSTPATEQSAAVNVTYQNWAIIGESRTTSKLIANNTIADNSHGVGPLLGQTSTVWTNGSESGTSIGWTSGDTIGTTQIGVSECSGLQIDDGSDGDLVNENSLLLIAGTDTEGEGIRYQTRVTARSASSGACTVTLETPLPFSFSSRSSAYILTERKGYAILLNFTMGFPNIDPGICTAENGGAGPASGHDCAMALKFDRHSNVLIQNMNIGPYGNQGRLMRVNNLVIRHSTFGPNRHGQRRQNNNNNLQIGGGSLVSFYNNIGLEGQIRITLADSSTQAGFYGFNWWVPQTTPNANDDATAT